MLQLKCFEVNVNILKHIGEYEHFLQTETNFRSKGKNVDHFRRDVKSGVLMK